MSVDEKIYYTEDNDEKIVYTEEDDREAMNEEYHNDSSKKEEPNNNSTEKEKRDNKIIMTIGYFSILFIIPMCIESCKKDEFIRHHVNQAIWLFIFGAITSVIDRIFGGIYKATELQVFNIIEITWSSIFGVIGLILFILQIIALWQDQKREVPLVGKIKLYK